MHPGPDSMGAPSSLTARRPNASSLPNFELPPPPLSNIQKFPTFSSNNSQSPATGNIGNLLTPPSNLSDGMSSHAQSSQNMSYNPNGYVWSPPPQGSTPYGFQTQAPSTSQSYATPRGLPPPPYELNHLPPFPSSGSMSAPSSLPTMSGPQSSMSSMMNSQNPVSSSAPHQSPIHSHQDSYSSRLPPTPTYHYNSQHSTTPQQSNFPYSTGPSPTQPSPLSAGAGMHRMSPAHSSAQVPSMQSGPAHSPLPYQRPYQSYPLPGPVLSNVNNPNGQLALVGGMHHGGMMPGFPNSGHAASMGHMYGQPHPGAHQAPPNDRPFKCDQCPQSFNRNHDLKRHKRIHLAVKPFPCGHCDKSFSRKDALKRHILVKGCGKAAAAAEADKHDGSVSPKGSMISESSEHKPVLSGH
ncbi:c2h2 finger domain [Diplodia corticola]|uniref:C2h2 finger domain n=1 Tax=Diplodia corticola TaxID=236234 RepID=A0A1J9R434_9PEZI|nr:c2h2 finger domain [Diplodia corticola]OJD35337.1 c2h2 finger domain [Diplodia corticola]